MAIQVRVLTPVLYTPNAGPGGTDEYFAPPGALTTHQIPSVVTAGHRIIAVVLQPFDNICDLLKFSQIDAVPSSIDSQGIQLSCASYPNQVGRVRMKLTVFFE